VDLKQKIITGINDAKPGLIQSRLTGFHKWHRQELRRGRENEGKLFLQGQTKFRDFDEHRNGTKILCSEVEVFIKA